MPTVYRTFQKIHVTGIRQNQDEADQDTTILNLIGNVLPLKGHLLLEDCYRSLVIRYDRKSANYMGRKLLAYTLINLRYFSGKSQ